MIFIFLYLFRHIDIFLIFLSLIFGIIVSLITFFYFYIYPNLAKLDYEKDIEDNLPFFSLYIYAYSGSNTNIVEILKRAAYQKDFGAISKELKYLISLIETFGYDFTSAIIEVANKTPSYRFKEFLYGLLSTIRAGGDLKEFIKIFAKESLDDYKVKLQIYNDKASLYITLYAFIFITFPMIILILFFIFSTISQNPEILNATLTLFLGIIPFSYVTYIYLIHISQPKL